MNKIILVIAMVFFVGCETSAYQKTINESKKEKAQIQLESNIQSFIGARIESIDVTGNPIIIVTEGGGIIKIFTSYTITENNFIPAQSDVLQENKNQ